MVLAERHGVTRLCLETDCQEFAALWENRDNNRPVIAPILMEIQERNLRFQDFTVLHASRLCSRVAAHAHPPGRGLLDTYLESWLVKRTPADSVAVVSDHVARGAAGPSGTERSGASWLLASQAWLAFSIAWPILSELLVPVLPCIRAAGARMRTHHGTARCCARTYGARGFGGARARRASRRRRTSGGPRTATRSPGDVAVAASKGTSAS
jgi:hypothetical protein